MHIRARRQNEMNSKLAVPRAQVGSPDMVRRIPSGSVDHIFVDEKDRETTAGSRRMDMHIVH